MEKKTNKGGVGKPFIRNDPRINRAGRRMGSRNKFTEKFVDAMLVDFEKHGEEVIQKVREQDPSSYIRVATALIPSKSESEVEVKDMTQETLSEIDWDVITGGKSANKKG